MKELLELSLLFLFIIAVICLLFGYLFFMLGFSRLKKNWLRRSNDLKGVDFSYFGSARAWFTDQQPADLWITSADGLKLHGYYLSAKSEPKQLIILHHGYTSQGKDMAIFARFYAQHYDAAILAIDMRISGQSEGKYLGFGWLEKDDTRLWIEKMNTLLGKKLPVILHGISLGASTILDLGGNACPDQVKIIIADSGFSDLNRQFKRQFKEIFHLPAFPFLPLGSLWCKLILGFSFDEASPINYADQIKASTLIFHGLKDMFVPHPMSDELYAKLTCPKRLVHYANAPHALTYPLNQEDYEKQVQSFIEEHL